MGQLEEEGHRVWPVNFNPGSGPIDRYVYVDLPPYRPELHLKLRLGRFVFTSIGLAIQRAP